MISGAVATVLLACCGPSPAEKAAAEATAKRAAAAVAAQAQAATDWKYLDRMLADTRDKFRDPDTVRFRKLAFRRWPRTDFGGQNYNLCGEANGTNGFGGYAGYRPFAAHLQHDDAGKPVMVLTFVDDDFRFVTGTCQNLIAVPIKPASPKGP